MSTKLLFQNKNAVSFLQDQARKLHGEPWVFIAIPHTADSWLRERFADILQPVSFVKADEENDERDYDSRMLSSLQAFSESSQAVRYRLLVGHFKVFQVNEVKAFSGCRLLTILRDPVDRLLADFVAQSAGLRGPLRSEAFVDFAKQTSNQNVLLQYLCPKNMWKPKECIAYIENRFDFIGIAEDQSLTMKLFYALEGARYNSTRLDESPTATFTRSELASDVVKYVSTLNALDYEIFRYFHDRLVSIKDSVFSSFENDKIFEKISYR